MVKVDNQILKRAKELQKQLSEDGYTQPIADCIEMAIEERKYQELAW